jgi:hypothetical protein
LHREIASETYSTNRLPTNMMITGIPYSSGIRFFTNTLLIDQYGNIDKVDKVFFSGFMGKRRAGDMLPMEYEP